MNTRALQLGVLLFPVLAAAVDVKYDVSARLEARGRTALPGDTGTGVTGDLELAPVGDLSLTTEHSSFLFQYTPTLIWREPQTGGKLLPLQRGRVAYSERFRHATLLLQQEGAWGLADIGSLRAPDGSLPTAVSEVQTLGAVPYLRSVTTGSLEVLPGRDVSFGLMANYSISGSPVGTVGGLPLQQGPSASLHARFPLTRRDGLTTTALFASSTFDTGQELAVVQLLETWDRALSRTMTFTIGGGAAVTREVVVATQGIPGTYLEVLPAAAASLGWRSSVAGSPVGFAASLRLAPFADRFTGFVYERLEGRLQANWQPDRKWVVSAGASGALAVDMGRAEQAGDRLVGGDAAVNYVPTTWLLLSATARVLWTEQPRTGAPGLVQAVGSVSVTVRAMDSLAW